MKITLDSNPSNAPCCVKIVAVNGRDVLVQTDTDWPSVAGSFGFSLASVQRCRKCKRVNTVACEERPFSGGETVNKCQCNARIVVCDHSGTDGTIKCDDCRLRAEDFIAAARQWLVDNDGATADDPGYFED